MWGQQGLGAGVEQLTEKEEQLLKLIEAMSNVGGERRGASMSGCKMAVWHVNILLTLHWSPHGLAVRWLTFKTTSIIFCYPL